MLLRVALVAFWCAVIGATTVNGALRNHRNHDRAANSDDEPAFTQYRSELFQFAGQPPLADWTMTNISGSVTDVLYADAADSFVMIEASASGTNVWVAWLRTYPIRPVLAGTVAGFTCKPSEVAQHGFAFALVCQATGTEASLGVTWINCTFGDCTVAAPVALATSPASAVTGRLQAVAVLSVENDNNDPRMLIGTSAGLWSCPPYTFQAPCVLLPMPNTTGGVTTTHDVARVYCLPSNVTTASDDFFGGRCFAVSRSNVCDSNICPADLVHVINASGVHHRYIRIPGVIDAWPRGITYDPLDDAIQFANSQALNTFYRNSTLWRVGGVHGGLPQINLTSAGASQHGAWFGSAFGAMAKLPDGTWKYFFGPRWLPGTAAAPTPSNEVTALAVSPAGHALVATRTGFSLIAREQWSLREKASELQSFEHLFDRWGLAPASIGLKVWGNPMTPVGLAESESANEGLWTSMYLGSQIFKYAVTKDPAVKANCWKAFYAMRKLCTVSGVRGLCAREYTNISRAGQHQWFPSPTYPGWWFNGNPSSDEITGHLHVYPIMHDLVAETDEERAIVIELIVNITGNIVDHGLILYQMDGVPTRWGRWDPATLNNDPTWYDERGVNSMQILGFISSAYRLTGNVTYANVFTDLVRNHQYADNMVNLKITQPNDVNFSDDELTFLGYLSLIWSARPSEKVPSNHLWLMVQKQLETSIQRTWDYVHRYRPDLWSDIYLMAFGADNMTASRAPRAADAVADLTWCLQTWPTSPVRWPINNTARTDVHHSPYQDRDYNWGMLLTTLLPYDEISLGVLNGDPFRKQMGNAGSMDNPAFFLYPYWLSKWLHVV